VSDLGRHGEVLVYCDTDACGGNARNQMLQIGFDNVINLGDLNAAAKTTGVAIIKN
jgi:rhodanese-related sulfurtransferase